MNNFWSIRDLLSPHHNEYAVKEDCHDMKRIREINLRIHFFSVSSRNLQLEERLGEFIEISKCLSSLLPPVSIKSLFDVDDLLYGEQIEHEHKSFVEDKALYHCIDFCLYENNYQGFVREGVRNIFMDTAFMQWIEHMPISFQDWPYQRLLKSKDVYGTCAALKIILADVHNKNKKFSFYTSKRIYDDTQLHMKYLTQIPQGSSTNGKRLSEFITQHVEKFMNLTDLNITVHGFDFFKASVVKMISERWFPAHNHIVSLIDTFMLFNSSERNELPNYLFNLMEGTDESMKEALVHIGHHHDANKPNPNLPQKLMRIFFDNMITNTLLLAEHLLNVEEKMKFIDAIYGYKIEPYYQTNNEYKYRAFNNKASMNNEAFGFDKEFTSFKEFQEQKLSYDNKDDTIFEKFLVYDIFLRNLHCMTIFHELFMELERKFEVKFPQSFVYSNFWERVTTIGLVPWYVKMIVMKCPFLLKSTENNFVFHMSFDDLTCEENEFINHHNWTNRKYDINPKSYANRRFTKPSPVALPAPQDYFVPEEKTFYEYLKKHCKSLIGENEENIRFISAEDFCII